MRAETTNDGKSRRETAQRRAFLQINVQVKWSANIEGKTKAATPSPKLQNGKSVRPIAPNHETKSLSLIRVWPVSDKVKRFLRQ